MADHYTTQPNGGGSNNKGNQTRPNQRQGQRYHNTMPNGQSTYRAGNKYQQPYQYQQSEYNSSSSAPSSQSLPQATHKQVYKSTSNPSNHVDTLPTHPLGYSKGTSSPDNQTSDLINDSFSHSIASNPLPPSVPPQPLDAPATAPINPQQLSPADQNSPQEEHSPNDDNTFHPVNNTDPSPPPDQSLEISPPPEAPAPCESDPLPEACPEQADPQQLAQMQAVMNNMYLGQMMMNPWMGMMPWMPFYPYSNFLQAQAHTHPYQQFQAPLPQEKHPAPVDPAPKPDTPASAQVQQSDTYASEPEPEQAADCSSVALSDDHPPRSYTPEPLASNTTESSSPSSAREAGKLSHSSLNDEPLGYDTGPPYPSEPAPETHLLPQTQMGMGPLGVAVGSTLANCTSFESWPNFSPTPAQQLMRPKQIPIAGAGPGIISSAVLQVQQTNQTGTTFGPFSPGVPLVNPAPTTSQAFSIGATPGPAPPNANTEPHSAPKSTALSSEASPKPSGFDSNTTAEPRIQHGIVEKESSSESDQSNEDDLDSHEHEPAFVQLEVGGRAFQVHAASFDSFPESKLYKIIHYTEPGTQNLGGAYTFDRDGNLFEVIISFVRTGRLDLPPYFSLKAVEREAEFFGMRDYMFEQDKQISPGSYFSFKRTLTLDMELQPGNDRQFQCIAVLDSSDHLTFDEVVCEGFCHLLMEAVDLTGILIGRKIIFDSQDPNAWKGTQHSYEQKPVTVYLILIRKPSGSQSASTTSCKASITYSTVFTFDSEAHMPGFYRR